MSPTTALILGLIGGALVVAAWAALRDHGRRRRVRRAAARGYAGEAEAPGVLRAAGFSIVEAQPRATYEYWVDGEPVVGEMCPDFLVRRRGRRYVAEVKTGAGRRPTSRGTRRQLLEYAIYFEVDGVVLVDADAGVVFEVEFPAPAPPTRPARWLLFSLVGAVIAAVAWALAH